jgi:hypothetical protein
VTGLASKRLPEGLQSPSAAESPKQDLVKTCPQGTPKVQFQDSGRYREDWGFRRVRGF